MYKKTVIFLYLVSSIQSHQFNRLHKIPADDDMLLFWKTSGMTKCTPFVASYIDCNRCVCGADSVLYCTRIICMENTNEYEYVSETLAPDSHHKRKKHKPKVRRRRRRKHAKGGKFDLYDDNYIG